MKLKLKKPLVVFDLETTGLDLVKDRIIQISYIKVSPDGSEKRGGMIVNPGRPIPPEVAELTGISNADVAGKPMFKEVAAQLEGEFKGCDFAGFNSNHFDIPLLVEEFIRAGVDFDVSNCRFVDVQNIYHKMEKRTLAAAYRFYCGKTLENAHTAMADTRATYEILQAQLDKYDDTLKNDVAFLSDFSRRNNNVDLAGRIVYDEQGVETINFGKYKGKHVVDVLRRDPGYLSWIMQGDFPQNTKQAFMSIRLKAGL